MSIVFKHYVRRDGSVMLFINRSNGVSVGVTDKGFSPYGKGVTPGKRNAFNAAFDCFEDAPPFTGDLANHAETEGCSAPVVCGPFTLVGTDSATIGGMPVSGDGGYVICRGRILKCGVAHEERKVGA